MPANRKILDMLFELKTNDGGIRLLIAWLDRFGNSKYLLPAHPDKCLLEMRAGDVVTFRRREILVVKRLKPWRTSECKDETEYSEIVCGEDWEARK